MKKRLSIILSYTLTLVLVLSMIPVNTFAGTEKVSTWEQLKEALESGETDIYLKEDAPIVATSDIEVTLTKDQNVRVYSESGEDLISMDYTNFGIHVYGEGQISFQNIPFANYTNPCLVNEASDTVEMFIENCGFFHGDGAKIEGKYIEGSTPKNTLKRAVSAVPIEITDGPGYIINTTDSFSRNNMFSVELEESMKFCDFQIVNLIHQNENATGNFELSVMDYEEERECYSDSCPVVDGGGAIPLGDLRPGNYLLTVSYSGDGSNPSDVYEHNIEITKLHTQTSLFVYSNDTGKADIYMFSDANIGYPVETNASVEVYQLLDQDNHPVFNLSKAVNNALFCNESIEVWNGYAETSIVDMPGGLYNVVVNVAEGEFFYKDTCNKTISVEGTQEITTEEPRTEEPTTVEPQTEEPTTELQPEPTTEEPQTEEPTTEPQPEPTTVEPQTEEPTTEPTTEEPTTEEPTTEEPTTEELTTVENATELTTVEVTSATEQGTVPKVPGEKDPRGSTYRILQLKQKKVGKRSLKVRWRKVKGAKKYVVYASKCGRTKKCKKIAVTTKNSYTYKKLKPGTYYKLMVVAKDKNNKVLSISKLVHIATKGGKKGNDKAVKANANKIALKVGKTFKLKGKAVPQSKELKVTRHRGVKYESDNKNIASVNGKGVVKAKAKGTCKIYVYTQNGFNKVVKVTVK
ncbi:MAG: Ig-like domain-containing protein [Eubacterium sp.]|nr:Ig-like domain-containing protein [Eubacterium sp.]